MFDDPERPRQERKSGRFLVLGLCFFALAGLLTGGTVGALTSSKSAQIPVHSIVSHSEEGTRVASTRQKDPQPLGCPQADHFTNDLVADGKALYTVKAHAVDKTGSCGEGKPIEIAGIYCKLWLVKRIPEKEILLFPEEQEKLTHPEKLVDALKGSLKEKKESFPEIVGLEFVKDTPQLQKSTAKGEMKWTFSVNPQVRPGSYNLLLLTDWQGRYFSWSWLNVEVQKATAQEKR